MENNLNYNDEKNNKTTNVLLILVLIVGVLILGLLVYKMFIYDNQNNDKVSKEYKFVDTDKVVDNYTQEELVHATLNNGVYKDINNLSSDEWKSYMVGVSLSSNLMTKIRGLNEYDEEYFKNISGNIVSDNTIASSFYLTKEERDSIAKTESKEINDFLLGQDGGSIDRYVISLEDAKNAVTKKFKDVGTLFDESFIYKSSGSTYVYIKSLNKIYGIVGSTIRTPILITQTKKTDYLYTVWFSKCHLKDECINEYENNKLEVYEVTFKKDNGNYIFDSIKIV